MLIVLLTHTHTHHTGFVINSANLNTFIWEKNIIVAYTQRWISEFFQIESIMIVVPVLLFIVNQTEFCLVHNQKENFRYDHIPLNLNGFRNIFLWCLFREIYLPPWNDEQSWVNTCVFFLLENIHYLFNNLYCFVFLNINCWFIECVDLTENERIRTQCWSVSKSLC